MKKKLVIQVEVFKNMKVSHMSTSDRVAASRKAKELVLAINEIYKETKDSKLMDMMKSRTVKKRRLKNG